MTRPRTTRAQRDAYQRRVLSLVVGGLATLGGGAWPLWLGLPPADVLTRAGLALLAGVVVMLLPRGWPQALGGFLAILAIVALRARGLPATETAAMHAAALLPFAGGLNLGGLAVGARPRTRKGSPRAQAPDPD